MPTTVHPTPASRKALLVLAAAAALELSAGRSATAQATAVMQVELAPQPLARSLIDLALQFDTVVSFAPGLVEGLSAPPVRGHHSLQDALAQALKGSGLAAEPRSAGIEIVRRPQAPQQLRPTILLDPVAVIGNRQKASGEGLGAQSAQSATRTETSLMELAQSVSVLTRDSLALQGEPTAAEAVRFVAGTGTPANEYSSLFLDPPVMVRGLPGQSMISGMRSLRSPGTIESAVIERIEIAKGPNGSVSGPAEIGGRGGMVNIELKRPGAGRMAEVRMVLDSRDSGTLRSSFDLASAGRDGLTWRVAGYGHRSGNTEGGYEPQRGLGALGSLRLRAGKLDATLSLLQDSRRIAPPAATVSQEDWDWDPDAEYPRRVLVPGRLTPASRSDRKSTRSQLADLDLRWQLSDAWRMGLLLRGAVDPFLRCPARRPHGRRHRHRLSQCARPGLADAQPAVAASPAAP